jgi:hypothetical protein
LVGVAVKRDEMGRTCGTTEKKKCLQSFGRNIGRKEIAWKTHA